MAANKGTINPMRIAMLSPTLGDAFGQEKVMRNSSALLRERGHEVYFIGEESAGEIPQINGVEIFPGLTGSHSLRPDAPGENGANQCSATP